MGFGQTEGAKRRLKVRVTGGVAGALAVVFALALVAVAIRLNTTWELPVDALGQVSARTREILARASAPVRITCFVEGRHPARRPAVRLLRGLQAASEAGPGAPVSVVFVDPRRDLAEARRLIDAGVSPDALVFESGERRLAVGADELIVSPAGAAGRRRRLFKGESVCAAAIDRLGRDGVQRIYWLTGHGEAAMDDYDPQTGYSDVVREIGRNGFELRDLRLWDAKGVPADAAALVVASPQHAVAAEESGWIQDYLNKGGRLLYLAPSRGRSGLEEVLSRWGLLVTPFRAVSTRTLSGYDQVFTDYGDHPITRGFGNTATVFLSPWCVETVSFGDAQAADRIRVKTLVQTSEEGWGEAGAGVPPRFDPDVDMPGPVAVAAAAERGGGASVELGFRPTRVVAVGEGLFVSNGMLGMRLNANGDLLLNMLNWLTGIDAAALPSLGGDASLASGLDREGWMRVLFWVAGVIPFTVLIVGFIVGARRRSAV